MEERRILARAAASNEQAWAALVDHYAGMLRAVARSMRLQPFDADDAAQQTWIALRENLRELREPEHIGAWLGVVMRRRCLALLALQRRERPDDRVGDRAETFDPPSVVGVISIEDSALWRLVDQLPGRERIVLRALFEVADRSYRDVAHELGMPIGSVGPVRMRALRRLATLLRTEAVRQCPDGSDRPSATGTARRAR